MIGPNNIISVKKITKTDSKEFYESTPSITGIYAYIEQVQPELVSMFNDNPAYDTYRIFIDFSVRSGNTAIPDIQNKDRIIDKRGNEYAVEGVQYFKTKTIPQHMEIIANKKYVS